VPANRIADSSPSDVYVSDPFVSSTTGGDVIQMQYEMKGESHQRVLRTVNQVESFLKSPNEFTLNSSPDPVASDRDLGDLKVS